MNLTNKMGFDTVNCFTVITAAFYIKMFFLIEILHFIYKLKRV